MVMFCLFAVVLKQGNITATHCMAPPAVARKAFSLSYANAVVVMSDINMQMSCCYLTRRLVILQRKQVVVFNTALDSEVVWQRDYGCCLGPRTQSWWEKPIASICVWGRWQDLHRHDLIWMTVWLHMHASFRLRALCCAVASHTVSGVVQWCAFSVFVFCFFGWK